MSDMVVAVVSYNTRAALQACLESMMPERPSEVVVIDNGSTDGSVAMLRARFPDVTVHCDPSNPGYGAAANRAMRLTRAPYLLLLNSDTILRPGAIDGLRKHLDEHPGAAVVGPRILNPDGSLQPSCFPFPHPLVTILGGTGLESLLRRLPWFRSRYLRTWAHDHVRSVPWVLGAALAIRRAAFDQLGGFREDFFMYMEETDLCYRARRAGWETHFTPAVEIIHSGGASTDRMRAKMRIRYYTSLMHYYRLHGTPQQLRLMYTVLRTGAVVKLLRDRLRMLVTSGSENRRRLEQDVEAWRQVLAGGWFRAKSEDEPGA